MAREAGNPINTPAQDKVVTYFSLQDSTQTAKVTYFMIGIFTLNKFRLLCQFVHYRIQNFKIQESSFVLNTIFNTFYAQQIFCSKL